MGDFGLWIVALIIMAIGLLGTITPGLPGMPLILAGIVLFAFGTELRVLGLGQLVAFLLLGALGMGLNLLGSLLGARRFGISRFGMLGAIAGLVVGLLLAGPFGLVIGPLVGATAFEMMKGRELQAALRSGIGVLVGYVFGALAEVVIALAMTGWFIWSTWGAVMTSSPPGLM